MFFYDNLFYAVLQFFLFSHFILVAGKQGFEFILIRKIKNSAGKIVVVSIDIIAKQIFV